MSMQMIAEALALLILAIFVDCLVVWLLKRHARRQVQKLADLLALPQVEAFTTYFNGTLTEQVPSNMDPALEWFLALTLDHARRFLLEAPQPKGIKGSEIVARMAQGFCTDIQQCLDELNRQNPGWAGAAQQYSEAPQPL